MTLLWFWASADELRGPPLEYWGGGLVFEINIFVVKMGEKNKWHGGNLINILFTKEVEINII